MSARVESEFMDLVLEEKSDGAGTNLPVEILADVLRIFAARGRALREVRQKNRPGNFDLSEPNCNQAEHESIERFSEYESEKMGIRF